MISEMAQCGPCMLVPAGLGAVGGLLMGLGAVKKKPGTCKTSLILAGAFCIFFGFLSGAYPDIERCRCVFPLGVCMFWALVVGGLLVMLAAFLYSKRQAVCALGLSLRARMAGLLNCFIGRWLRRK